MKKHAPLSLLAGFAQALFLRQVVAGDSGFIEDMPELVQDADRTRAMSWVQPGVDRSAYTRVMLEPVTIFISPDSGYQGLDADELKALAEGFREAVSNAPEPEVPVVNQAGPGVPYVRASSCAWLRRNSNSRPGRMIDPGHNTRPELHTCKAVVPCAIGSKAVIDADPLTLARCLRERGDNRHRGGCHHA